VPDGRGGLTVVIIEDERNTCKAIGECQQCHTTAIVRPVMARDWFGSNRGYFRLCFSCFAPRIRWKNREDGQVFESPAEPAHRISEPARRE